MFSRLNSALRIGSIFRERNNLLRPNENKFIQPLAGLKRHLHSYSTSDGTETDVLYKAVDIELKGHDLAVMTSYENFLSEAAKELDIIISANFSPPQEKKLWTLLKSAHVHKKHRVQYETRTNFRVIKLKHLTGSTADTFLEYIQRNLPEGMAMKVTRHAIEALPKHLL